MEKELGFDYTTYAKNRILEGFKDNLESFYCREDFADILEKFDEAALDNKLFWASELEEMCGARGVDFEILEKKPSEREQELANVPTRDELLDDLIKLFYENYKKCYSAEDFMTRIVRRLSPKEYAEDPVRVAILKTFILGAGFQWKKRSKYRTEKVLQWAIDRFSDKENEEYNVLLELEKKMQREKREGKEEEINRLRQKQLEMIVGKLDDSIFSEENLNFDKLTDTESFLLNVRALSNWLKPGNKLVGTAEDEVFKGSIKDIPLAAETRDKIRHFCNENGLDYDNINDSDKNLRSLNAIAKAIRNNELSEQGKTALTKTVFPALKEDFHNFRNNTYYKTEDGELKTLQYAYKNYLKDERKKKNGYEILRLCDDYAKGTFRNYSYSRNTRIHLYYFAIMFDMTVKESETDEPDPNTDVDKNLFRDYYNNNVLRFLEGERTTLEKQSLEAEPTGDGINYKSYEETIYLYFLCRKDLGTNPGERIDLAEKLIHDCITEAKDMEIRAGAMGKGKEISREDFTGFYQAAYFYEALKIEPENLPNFILKYYKIDISQAMQLTTASGQVSAFENIKWVQEIPYFGNREPDNHAKQSEPAGKKPEQYEWLYKIPKSPSKIIKEEWLWVIPDLLRKKPECSEYFSDKKFMQIIDNLNESLKIDKDAYSVREKRISRSRYLAAFLYGYIQEVKEKGMEERRRNFPDVYDDFLEEANAWLEEGKFQLFNSTNVVDLYVFLTYYAFLVRNMDVFDFERDLECALEKAQEIIRARREEQTELQEEKEGSLLEETDL